MKCSRCGADVEAQRFCIYCGERLVSHDVHVSRAPSGVMRIRHRANISQTSLPEVQKKNDNLQRNKLASLNPRTSGIVTDDDVVASISSQRVQNVSRTSSSTMPRNVSSTEGNNMKDSQQSHRQSRELEALLFKLNGSLSEDDEPVQNRRSDLDESMHLDESSTSMPNIEENVCDAIENDRLQSVDGLDRTYSDEEFNSFFELDEADTTNRPQDVSSSIPVGSGSFARVPSGGFHLVFDTIRSACAGLVSRIKSLKKLTSRKDDAQRNDNNGAGYYVENNDKSRRIAKIAIMAALLVAIIVVIVSVASGDKKETASPEMAAQQTVAGNDDFAILPLDDPDEGLGDTMADLKFDENDFTIPDLDNTNPGAANDSAPVPAAAAGRLKELRLYDSKDNVLAVVSNGQAFKTKSTCIMRKGPASRFDTVTSIPSGKTIQILTNVDEDWVLQAGGVWTKPGHPSKLGPGDQFANALKGMKIPQPKSRVISAKNWKYVQYGGNYGYVGPACFK